MKKQTQKSQLEFSKNSVVELNDDHLYEVQAGSSWGCSIAGTISIVIATVVDKIFVTAVQY